MDEYLTTLICSLSRVRDVMNTLLPVDIVDGEVPFSVVFRMRFAFGRRTNGCFKVLLGYISGDHAREETHVPIPNTTVKLTWPMIVQNSAKVGCCRVFGGSQKCGPLFLCAPRYTARGGKCGVERSAGTRSRPVRNSIVSRTLQLSNRTRAYSG